MINQQENAEKEIKNYPNRNHSQILSQNNIYLNKSITPESNKTNQCYTQRDNYSNIITKILKNNNNQNININNIPPTYNNKSKYYYLLNNNNNNNINNNNLLEHQLKQLQLNYIALKNDNIIFKEDINKLMDINKKLEKELSNE